MCVLSSGSPSGGNRALDRREPLAAERHDVHDHLHVAVVERGDHLLRVAREQLGVELVRRLRLVPALRAEAGAEIHDRVDGDLLLAERVDDLGELLLVAQRAVRLHVAERPLGRHHGAAGDLRDVVHERGRIVRVEHEHVVRAGDEAVLRRAALHLGRRAGPARPAALARGRALAFAIVSSSGAGGFQGVNLPCPSSRRSNAPHGVATYIAQPLVPTSSATGLRRAVRRGLPPRPHVVCAAVAIELNRGLAPVLVVRGSGPPSPMPRIGWSSFTNVMTRRRRTSSFWMTRPPASLTVTVSGSPRTSTCQPGDFGLHGFVDVCSARSPEPG